jgi:hypothetical protein
MHIAILCSSRNRRCPLRLSMISLKIRAESLESPVPPWWEHEGETWRCFLMSQPLYHGRVKGAVKKFFDVHSFVFNYIWRRKITPAPCKHGRVLTAVMVDGSIPKWPSLLDSSGRCALDYRGGAVVPYRITVRGKA